MRHKLVFQVAAALALSAAAAVSALAAGNPLAGTWSQSSNTAELALTPKTKVVPRAFAGSGTIVGTFGSGPNQMVTVIDNSYSSTKINRQMTLSVRPDGRFLWDIVKIAPTSEKDRSCVGTTHESKEGRVSFSGSKVTFDVTGGTGSFKDTCNANRNNTGPYAPRTETYDYSISGGALRIKGTGGVDWSFRRK